jgi:hypothetical protein
VGSCHGIEGGQVVELADFQFVERSLQRAVSEGGGEVEERARRGGDGDAVVLGDLLVAQLHRAVDPQTTPLGAATGRANAHVDPRGGAGAYLPQRRGRRMAQHRAGPGGEHRGHATSVGGEDGVTDGVDALMNAM